MATRVRLATIPSAEEALCNLVTFDFVVLHLFSMRERHSSVITDLLCIIERLDELHTKAQGMISSPPLATTLIFYVSQRWSMYLNSCVDASALESQDALGYHVPFLLEIILADM